MSPVQKRVNIVIKLSMWVYFHFFRSLVKSFVVFGAAIFVAREYAAMEAEDMAERAAENLTPS